MSRSIIYHEYSNVVLNCCKDLIQEESWAGHLLASMRGLKDAFTQLKRPFKENGFKNVLASYRRPVCERCTQLWTQVVFFCGMSKCLFLHPQRGVCGCVGTCLGRSFSDNCEWHILLFQEPPPKMWPLRPSGVLSVYQGVSDSPRSPLVFHPLGPAQKSHMMERHWGLTLPAFVFDQEETGSEWPLTMRPTFSWPTPRMTWRIGWRPSAGSSGPPSEEVSTSHLCS